MTYKFLKKIFIIIFILLISIIEFSTISLSAGGLDDIINGGDSFILAANEEKLNTTEMKNISDTIYNTLLGVGVIVAVVIGTILGIQYMSAAAEDKAQIKESMIPFIIGCIVVFGAFAIWKAIVLILK